MFLSKKLCYLEMHKTASQHIAKLLDIYVKDGKRIGNHNRPNKEIYNSDRIFLGSIRDPWEWYVSLWSFGCIKRGFIYNKLTSKKIHFKGLGLTIKPLLFPYIFYKQFQKPVNIWKELYSDSNNKKKFIRWLNMIFSNERKYDTGDGFGLSSINSFAGLMTYRYLSLYSSDIKKIFDGSIKNYNSLKDFDNKFNVLNHTIRNESLEENFINFLKVMKIEITNDHENEIRNMKKTNTSLRENKINELYDSESIDLVYNREKLIIDKYGYKKPKL